jgi:hypothetical protein
VKGYELATRRFERLIEDQQDEVAQLRQELAERESWGGHYDTYTAEGGRGGWDGMDEEYPRADYRGRPSNEPAHQSENLAQWVHQEAATAAEGTVLGVLDRGVCALEDAFKCQTC